MRLREVLHGRGRSVVVLVPVLFVLVWLPGVADRTVSSGVDKSILVTVLDQSGAPVKDLTTADFSVRENDTAREVTAAKLATDPLSVALLIDTTPPTLGVTAPTREIRAGLTTFVTTLQTTNPDTQIAIMDIAGAAVMNVKFTTNTADLTKYITRLFPSQETGAVLLEGLVDASRQLSRKPSPRRAIVSVTFNSPENSSMPPANVGKAVRDANVSYWAISIQSSGDAAATSSMSTPARELVLENVTRQTGGLRLTALSAGALESMLKSIAEALAVQYVVTYKRPDGGAPVKMIQAVTRRGTTVLMAPLVK
jgi:VWFA-related protein